MLIRDSIHGAIDVEPNEAPVMESRYFQRLRQIKQLGFAEYSYPGATHNRYSHSVGAMHVASRVCRILFEGSRVPGPAARRFRAVTRLGALLHDLGHGPLSHTTEFAMPRLGALTGSGGGASDRQATHEDYTLKMILDSGLTPLLEKAGAAEGFGPRHIAGLIDPSLPVPGDFFTEAIDGVRVDFRTVLAQIVSSELDADRMDYLRRDSLFAGVSYGEFDFEWLLGNLTFHIHEGRAHLALEHRALYAFEDFLISRFHMFLMVYFHHKSVVYDEMLGKYFSSRDCDYSLPANIESYCSCNDAHLAAHLARSSNAWAQRIREKRPYQTLIELHSGIPATKKAAEEQGGLLLQVQRDLAERKIDFILSKSTGELSKYFHKPGAQIYVRYDNHYSAPTHIPIEQCTDLFLKYAEKRSITRLYVSPENAALVAPLGKANALQLVD
jgi:HD superfamily phosphohydrolase